MDFYIQILVVACLTGMTALLAHKSAAVFHDGIRPILPQLIEGFWPEHWFCRFGGDLFYSEDRSVE